MSLSVACEVVLLAYLLTNTHLWLLLWTWSVFTGHCGACSWASWALLQHVQCMTDSLHCSDFASQELAHAAVTAIEFVFVLFRLTVGMDDSGPCSQQW